jgi:hypothetical protein
MGVYGYGWSGTAPIPEGYLTVRVPTPDGDLEREILHPANPGCRPGRPERADLRNWLASRGAGPVDPTDPDGEIGRELFRLVLKAGAAERDPELELRAAARRHRDLFASGTILISRISFRLISL